MNDSETARPAGDAEIEAAVLRLLLIQHPARLTMPELRDRLAETEDRIEAAIVALSRSDLVLVSDSHVAPSRAALHFDGLGID